MRILIVTHGNYKREFEYSSKEALIQELESRRSTYGPMFKIYRNKRIELEKMVKRLYDLEDQPNVEEDEIEQFRQLCISVQEETQKIYSELEPYLDVRSDTNEALSVSWRWVCEGGSPKVYNMDSIEDLQAFALTQM